MDIEFMVKVVLKIGVDKNFDEWDDLFVMLMKGILLEHSLNGDDGIAVCQRILFGGITELFVDDDNILGESYTRT